MSKPLIVGLLWHSFTSDNLGVGALSVANASLICARARRQGREVEFRVLGPDGGLDYAGQIEAPIRRLQYSLRRPRALIGQLRECDVIFDIGGGDSFTDQYGRLRFLHLAYTKACALASKRPLILSPQTIGPFIGVAARRVADRLLSRCTRVFARDEESARNAPRGSRVEVACDVAFRLPWRPDPAGHEAPWVGVNVSGLLFSGGYTRNDQFGMKLRYDEFCHALVESLGEMGARVHLIGHVNSAALAVEDDYRVCETLHRQYPETVLAPRFRDPVEAKSYLSALDFLTGARMHATIAAFSTGVPVAPVSYSGKFAGLYGSLGYRYVVDGRAMSTEGARRFVLQTFRDRARVRAEMPPLLAEAQRRLAVYTSYLDTALERL